MAVNNDYNIRMITEAFNVLTRDGAIDVYALRDQTRVKLDLINIDCEDNKVIIDNRTRELMLRDVARKAQETADYYFFSTTGERCLVSRRTIKEFQELVNINFPQNVIYGSLSVIDRETEVELISVEDYSFMKKTIADFNGVKSASPHHHLSTRYSILTIYKFPMSATG